MRYVVDLKWMARFIGGNPITRIDPDGQSWFALGKCLASALGGALAGDKFVKYQNDNSNLSDCDNLSTRAKTVSNGSFAFSDNAASTIATFALLGAGAKISGLIGVACSAVGGWIGVNYSDGTWGEKIESFKEDWKPW